MLGRLRSPRSEAGAPRAQPGLTRRLAAGFDRPVQLHGILFDYGGTLDGPGSHWLDRMVELYREAGVELPFERIKDAFYRADEAAYGDPTVADMSLAELMDFHVGAQLGGLGVEDPALRRQVATAFVRRSERALARSRAVLTRLAGSHRLGVVSNFYGNVHRILADAGIAPLLTTVADSQRVGWRKPDPRIFAHALNGLGTEPSATLHVGDSYARDVRAAKAVGLRTAWVAWPDARALAPEPAADLTIVSLEELLPRLGLAAVESPTGPR